MALCVARVLAMLTCYCLSTLLTLDARLTPLPPVLSTAPSRPHHRNKSTTANTDLHVTAGESTANGMRFSLAA